MNKVSILIIMLFFSILDPSYSLSSIHTINQFTELSNNLSDITSDDLVLFDIDYVLTIPDDKILRPCGEKLRKELRSQLKKVLTKPELDFLDSKTVIKARVGLVDLGMPNLIKKLQKKTKNIIALTSSGVGSLGIIERQENLKVTEIRQFGIDFSSAFPTYQHQSSTINNNLLPMFYQGILFAIPDKKGQSLSIFLKNVKINPARIVFVEDRIENIRAVETECRNLGIDFLGLHYIAAENMPGQVDENVARYQYVYLVKNKKWLNDEEATLLVNK